MGPRNDVRFIKCLKTLGSQLPILGYGVISDIPYKLWQLHVKLLQTVHRAAIDNKISRFIIKYS